MSDAILYAILGGTIIGLSAAGMFFSNGKILGVSGIVGGVFSARSYDLLWRLTFILGLLLGGGVLLNFDFGIMSIPINRSTAFFLIGGLLVGIGTTMGNGCTSGHGVCGVSRLSPRSLLATLTFIVSGILTVALYSVFSGGN